MTDAVAGPTTKEVEFDGTMENAYGSPLETAITFEGSYEHILNYEAIPAKELPDEDDVLSYVNAKRKANARQKSMQDALDAAGIVKPTLENNVSLQIRTMVKSLVASGKYNEKQATDFAKSALGV